MKLEDYLKRKNLTQDQFAELVGISQAQISRYLRGAIPGREHMASIRKATDNRVGPEDFYPTIDEAELNTEMP